MPTTQEIPTASPIGRELLASMAREGQRHRALRLRLPLSRIVVRRSGRGTIANGKITKLDTAAAEKDAWRACDPSSQKHRQNFPFERREGNEGICIERRPAFEDDVVRYYGQYVALAVADTFESAKAAADAGRR